MLRFGPFELDPEGEELRRSGTLVRLAHQPFRILLLLIRRAGEVVSREEIHAAIWGDETYVDFEHGINSAIRQIRSALADNAEQPRYIRTLPRRGYSFIAAVEHVANPAEPVVEPKPSPPARPAAPRGIVAVAIIVALLAASYRFVQTSPSSSKRSHDRSRAIPPSRPSDRGSGRADVRRRIARHHRADCPVRQSRSSKAAGERTTSSTVRSGKPRMELG